MARGGPTLITPTWSYCAGVPGAWKPGIHVTASAPALGAAMAEHSAAITTRASRRRLLVTADDAMWAPVGVATTRRRTRRDLFVHLHKQAATLRGMEPRPRAEIAEIVARIPLDAAARAMAGEIRAQVVAFGRLPGTSEDAIVEGVERSLRRWSRW